MNDDTIRVLLVEDSATEARLVQGILAQAAPHAGHFSVEWTDSLSASLERLDQGGFDAVLLDLVLPDSQGLDTFLRLREHAPRLPIIVLSGLDDEGLAVEAVRRGAQDYLVKGQADSRLLTRSIRYAVERSRSEALRRQSEARLGIISELTSDFAYVFRLEPDGRLVLEWLSDAFRRITGFTADDLRLRGGWRALIHPDDLSLAEEQGRAILSGRAATAELRIVTRDGETRWLRSVGRLEGEAERGGSVRLVGAAQDITAQKEAEEALRREHDLLSQITETSPAGIVVVDRQGQIIFANPYMLRTLGLTRDEITQRAYNAPEWHITDFDGNPFPDEQLPFRQVMATGRPVHDIRHAIEWPSGQRRFLSINAAPLVDASGQVEGVAATVEDVTERIEAERKLRQSEATLRSIFRAAPIGIGLTTDRILGWTNETLQQMVGYSGEEMAGQSVRMLYDSDEEFERVGREKHADMAHYGSGSIETRFRRKDGRCIDVLLSSTALDPGDPSAGVIFTALDITERRQAESALRASEDKFSRAFRSSPDAITISTLGDGRYVDVNEAFLEMSGYRREEVIGHTSVELGLWVDPEERLRLVRALQERGQVRDLEFRMRSRSGEVGTVLMSAEPVVIGGETCLLAISKDITGRKQAEEQVRRQAEALAALHETALDLAAQRALPDLLQAIVRRATELLGGKSGTTYLYRPASDDLEHAAAYNMTGTEWQDLVLRRGEGLAGKVLETGRPLAVENYSQWEGRSPQFEGCGFTACVAVPICWGERFLGVLDVDGEAPRVFSADDIALLERFTPLAAAALENARLLAAERERRQVAEILLQASAMLGSTLELDQVLALILRQLRQVVPYDSASVQRLEGDSLRIVAGEGFEPAQVVGLTFPLSARFPNERVIHTRSVVSLDDVARDYPHFYQEADSYHSGHIRSWLGVPLLVKDRVIGMLALDRAAVHPYTAEGCQLALAFANQAAMAMENARLYGDLQLQMEQLKSTQAQLVKSAKLAAIGELAAGVAHELNNPLTSVLGFAEILMTDLPPEHPGRKDAETIFLEAGRARDIIRGLLDFARQTRPQKRPAGINDLLHATLALIRQHLSKTGVTVVEEYAPNLEPLDVDVGQLKQVFLNLISNAVQAMPAGGTLRLRTRRDGPWVAAEVADTGAGIPPEVQAHLFEPFVTTKPSGTGLGLSVSLGIVQEHGGRITVESEVGRGSTFTVWLPARSAGTS